MLHHPVPGVAGILFFDMLLEVRGPVLLKEPDHRLRQRIRILRRHDKPGPSVQHDLRQAADVRRDHRQAEGVGDLDHPGLGRTLIRQNAQVRRRKVRLHLVVRQVAVHQRDIPRRPGLPDQLFILFLIVLPEIPHDKEVRLRPRRPDRRQGTDQVPEALVLPDIPEEQQHLLLLRHLQRRPGLLPRDELLPELVVGRVHAVDEDGIPDQPPQILRVLLRVHDERVPFAQDLPRQPVLHREPLVRQHIMADEKDLRPSGFFSDDAQNLRVAGREPRMPPLDDQQIRVLPHDLLRGFPPGQGIHRVQRIGDRLIPEGRVPLVLLAVPEQQLRILHGEGNRLHPVLFAQRRAHGAGILGDPALVRIDGPEHHDLHAFPAPVSDFIRMGSTGFAFFSSLLMPFSSSCFFSASTS